MPFTTDQPAANPSGEIVQFPAPELKLSLNRSEPTFIDTGTVNGLLETPFETTVTVSPNVPTPVVVVSGVMMTELGVDPDVVLKPNQMLLWLAVQLRDPVPVLKIRMLWGLGLSPIAPKNVTFEGTTDNAVLFTTNVTGTFSGELLAPGADTATAPG